MPIKSEKEKKQTNYLKSKSKLFLSKRLKNKK